MKMCKRAGLTVAFAETALWFCITISPVTNDAGETVLFLLTLKDITSTKIPTEEESGRGLGRIAKLARTVTKARYNPSNSTVERFSPKSNTKTSLVRTKSAQYIIQLYNRIWLLRRMGRSCRDTCSSHRRRHLASSCTIRRSRPRGIGQFWS